MYTRKQHILRKSTIIMLSFTLGIVSTVIAAATYDANIQSRANRILDTIKSNASSMDPLDVTSYYTLVRKNITSLMQVLTVVDDRIAGELGVNTNTGVTNTGTYVCPTYTPPNPPAGCSYTFSKDTNGCIINSQLNCTNTGVTNTGTTTSTSPTVTAYVTGIASATNPDDFTNKAKAGTHIQLHYTSSHVVSTISYQIFKATGPLDNTNLATGTSYSQYANLTGNTNTVYNIPLQNLAIGSYRVVVTGCATTSGPCVSTSPQTFEVISATANLTLCSGNGNAVNFSNADNTKNCTGVMPTGYVGDTNKTITATQGVGTAVVSCNTNGWTIVSKDCTTDKGTTATTTTACTATQIAEYGSPCAICPNGELAAADGGCTKPKTSLFATKVYSTTVNPDIPGIYNSYYSIRWGAVRATSCVASGGWSGSKSVSSSIQASTPLSNDITYTLTCSNTNGSDTASVTLKRDCPPSSTYSNGQCVCPANKNYEAGKGCIARQAGFDILKGGVSYTTHLADLHAMPGDQITIKYDALDTGGCTLKILDSSERIEYNGVITGIGEINYTAQKSTGVGFTCGNMNKIASFTVGSDTGTFIGNGSSIYTETGWASAYTPVCPTKPSSLTDTNASFYPGRKMTPGEANPSNWTLRTNASNGSNQCYYICKDGFSGSDCSATSSAATKPQCLGGSADTDLLGCAFAWQTTNFGGTGVYVNTAVGYVGKLTAQCGEEGKWIITPYDDVNTYCKPAVGSCDPVSLLASELGGTCNFVLASRTPNNSTVNIKSNNNASAPVLTATCNNGIWVDTNLNAVKGACGL